MHVKTEYRRDATKKTNHTHQENCSSKLTYMREAQREIYKLYANVPPLKKIHVTPMQFNFFFIEMGYL